MKPFAPVLASILACFALEGAAATGVPTRGQSMDAVLQHFGEPESRLPAVGSPPITRWIYPGFTVYFEHRWTIHSVRHDRHPPLQPPTQPPEIQP